MTDLRFEVDDCDDSWTCRVDLKTGEVAHLLLGASLTHGSQHDCTPCVLIREKLQQALDRSEADKREWVERVKKAAVENLPQLRAAQERGTIVASSAYNLNWRGAQLIASGDDHWVGTGKVLAANDIRLQTVIHTRPGAVGGGCSVIGYRLAPEGDDRTMVEITEAIEAAEGHRP